MKEPQQPTPASSFQWGRILTHPITVVLALWAFVPLGIGLFLMNPVIRKDRRWWAGVAVWIVLLFFAGRWSSQQSLEATTEDVLVAKDTSSVGDWGTPVIDWGDQEKEKSTSPTDAPPNLTPRRSRSIEPFQQRLRAFMLRYQDGMSYYEVVAILGQPNSIDSRDIGFIKPGVTHKVATWDDPIDDGFISLGFENNKLTGVKGG